MTAVSESGRGRRRGGNDVPVRAWASGPGFGGVAAPRGRVASGWLRRARARSSGPGHRWAVARSAAGFGEVAAPLDRGRSGQQGRRRVSGDGGSGLRWSSHTSALGRRRCGELGFGEIDEVWREEEEEGPAQYISDEDL
jgi:hypothetical protein